MIWTYLRSSIRRGRLSFGKAWVERQFREVLNALSLFSHMEIGDENSASFIEFF